MRSDKVGVIGKQVQSMYDEIGVNFSTSRQKKYGESQNWPVVQEYLDTLKPGDSILDLGCGNGRLISGLTKGVIYKGLDFSTTLINEAKTYFPEYSFSMGDVTDPAMWEKLGKYDAIYLIAVLHHIPTRKEQLYIIEEAKKHIKNNGTLVLTVWNLWQSRYLSDHIHSLYLKLGNLRHVAIPYANKWKRFCTALDRPYLIKLMMEAGWDVIEAKYVDRDGRDSDMLRGRNLVVVARS